MDYCPSLFTRDAALGAGGVAVGGNAGLTRSIKGPDDGN
jgi:hypothetical protein